MGLDRVTGVIGTKVFVEWVLAGGTVETVPQITPADLAARIASGDAAVIDVRGQSEWLAGHIPGAPNIPLGFLTDRLSEMPHATTLVLQCKGGGRSSIASSLLLARGLRVANLSGGFEAWEAAGLPVDSATGDATT